MRQLYWENTVEPALSTALRVITKEERPQSGYRQERPQVAGRRTRGKGQPTVPPQSAEQDYATHHQIEADDGLEYPSHFLESVPHGVFA